MNACMHVHIVAIRLLKRTRAHECSTDSLKYLDSNIQDYSMSSCTNVYSDTGVEAIMTKRKLLLPLLQYMYTIIIKIIIKAV